MKYANKSVEKGLDIKIAIDLFYYGFNNSFDLAVICTGDKDFLPVIEEIKNLGKRVYIAAFEHSYAEDLIGISDEFINLSEYKDKIKYD